MKPLPAVLVIAVLAGCTPIVEGAAPSTTAAVTDATTSTTTPAARLGLAVVPPGGAELSEAAGGPVAFTAHEGLVFPILEVDDPWYHIVDTCGRDAWVGQGAVTTVPPSIPGTPGPGFDLSSGVIVVDAGHGGRDLGAKGATGVWESDVNLEIAQRLRERLNHAHSIDWETGTVRSGDDYPPVRQVWMTRAPNGPLNGDIELALAYRVEMANRVGADALVSIHNNSAPGVVQSTPGTDVFYSVAASGSDRLASLIHEELMRGLGELGSEFGAAEITGARTRVEPDGTDFYGVLRRGEQPTVIVEGLYISEPAEERILASGVGQQVYADGVYRGLIRFLTTDDNGTAVRPPEVFDADVGSATYESCVVPRQP
ncbi:MAG: N-acetylmuramoyl-L-alanine amidase family protein [Acidimicrobiia bacterium]